MPVRIFADPQGRTWQVWAVYPGGTSLEERRRADRRDPGRADLYEGPERRSGTERRRGAPRIDPGLANGWLAFESGGEKRRLAPIPAGWDAIPDAALAELLAGAKPVAQVKLI